MIALFLIWSYYLIISRESPEAINFQDIFHPGYSNSNLLLSNLQSGHFKMFSINRTNLVKYRYCEFNFKCLAFLNLSKIQSKVNGQTINYSIIISMQKIAQSINSFLIYGINTSPIFDHAYPKHLEVFTCPEFVSTFQKSVYFFYSFFRYSQCWSPVSRVLKPT